MLVSSIDDAQIICAIYRTSSIGDVVLATAGLDYLANIEQRVFVYWLGREPSLALVAAAYPQIKPVLVDRTGTVELIDALRSVIKKVDFIVDLQKNLRSQIITSGLAKLFRVPVFRPRKYGFSRGVMVVKSRVFGRTQAASTDIQTGKFKQYERLLSPVIEAAEKFVNSKNIKLKGSYSAIPKLPVFTDLGERAWQKELKFGQWLAVAPGASHPTKAAPQELFLQTLQQLLKLKDTQASLPKLLFLGDERDRDVALALLDQLHWPAPSLNLAGKLSLWESALACSAAQVLLSNDSSLAHIAEAVGVPVAVLFGPTVEAFGFSPRMEQSRAFSALLGCRPCSKHGKASCRYHDLLCFKSIATSEVSRFLADSLKPQ